MRIAFFGNTNNYPLPLVLELRNRGYEVDLYCDRPDPLHNPYNRIPELKGAPWVKNVANLFPYAYSYFVPSLKKWNFYSELKEYDFVYYNGLPALIAWVIGVPYCVLITGSDLDVYGNLKKLDLFSLRFLYKNGLLQFIRQYFRLLLILSMRKSIKLARFYNYFKKGFLPHGDAILNSINPVSKDRLAFMIGNNESIKFSPLSDNGILRVFCGARLNWVRPMKEHLSELDYKDVDKLIRGVALFVERMRIPIQLCLVKKGVDIEDTVSLVSALGLDEYVVWFDEMSQAELYKEFDRSDVVVDQLGISAMGMVGLDALCMGRPVITNVKGLSFNVPDENYPICVASSPEEVFKHLRDLVDYNYRKNISKLSRQYVDRVYSPKVIVDKLVQLMKLS